MSRIVYAYRSSQGRQGEQPNFLVRIVAGVASALVLIVSAFLGLFIFLAALGILAIVGTVMGVRLWLFKRRIQTELKRGASQGARGRDYIDVEYKERE